MRVLAALALAGCAAKQPARQPPPPATGDLWTCTCACDDRAGGPAFQPAIVGCAPIGLDDTIGVDRDTACSDVCTPYASIGLHEFAYIGPCATTVLAPDGFADGRLTGPSSCDPSAHVIGALTDVAAYHATVDPARSTMTLDAFDHIDAALGGRIAFDFDIPLAIGTPTYVFFNDIQLLSTGDVPVQVFAATDIDGRIGTGTMAFRSSAVLPVRWRDAYGPRGINPESGNGWSGQLDLSARSLVLDLSGADPSDASWTFSMHVEAVVDDLPPIANTGGDLTVPCASPNGTPVTLDASASSDPDPGDAATRFQWLGFGGSPALSHDATASVTIPGVGSEWFEVHVYDRQLGASYLREIVTVAPSASCP